MAFFGSGFRGAVPFLPDEGAAGGAPAGLMEQREDPRFPRSGIPPGMGAEQVAPRRRGLFGGRLNAEMIALIGAALKDASAGGSANTAAMMGIFDKRREDQERQAREAALMERAQAVFGDDPRAMLLFETHPEALMGALAKRYEPRELTAGNTYLPGVDEDPIFAPKVEKFDDRFGVYDGENVSFSEARGPTFQEETGRQNANETARHNRVSEGLDQQRVGISAGHLGIARERLARGEADGGGEDGGGGGGGVVSVTSAAQRDSLPPGTLYRAPDGVVRRKR